MKKIFVFLVCVLLLGGCASKQKADERWPAEINGYTFTAPPMTAVSLSPSVTETLYMLGYGGRLAGISEFCRIPASAEALPRCGNALLPDLGDIGKLSPDILFCQTELSAHDRAAVEQTGAQIVIVPQPETVEQLLDNCRLICAAFEGTKTADLRVRELASFFEVTLDYIADEIEPFLETDTTAVYLRRPPLTMATGDSLEGMLLERLGFANPAAEYTDWSYPAEEAEGLSPDYIFCDRSASPETLAASDYYKESGAVLNGHIFELDAADFERRSPRLFFALEEVMKEAFPDGFDEEKPGFVIDIEPPPEPEKSWWQKFVDKLWA